MKPNILLVVMDSVRAANMSLYGYEKETTPFLEELGQSSAVYEQARAPGSWSLPSHTSLFTGYHVAEHGIVEPNHRLATGHTIFEELQKAGYTTGVFSGNPWLTSVDTGLDAGFDIVEGCQHLPFPEALDPVEFTASQGQGEYAAFFRAVLDDERPVRSLLNGVYNKVAWDAPWLLPDRAGASADAEAYTELFLEWTGDRDEPWAACVNFMDAHAPYEPATEFDNWGGEQLRTVQNELKKPIWSFHGGDAPWWQAQALSALYDGCIRQIDAEIALIVSALRERGEFENTLLIITSDHGEGFGEPSRLKPDTRVAGHVEGIHERLLHVPLLVNRPGNDESDCIREPATLSRFPDVVRSELEGRDADFVPDGPVVASSHGLTEPNMRLAREYCGDGELWRFRGTMRAVYEDNDDVEKSATWEGENAALACVDASTSYVSRRGTDVRASVESTFDKFEDAGVRESFNLEDVNADVERRLQDLGYAD